MAIIFKVDAQQAIAIARGEQKYLLACHEAHELHEFDTIYLYDKALKKVTMTCRFISQAEVAVHHVMQDYIIDSKYVYNTFKSDFGISNMYLWQIDYVVQLSKQYDLKQFGVKNASFEWRYINERCKMRHAYIFVGPPKTGKSILADKVCNAEIVDDFTCTDDACKELTLRIGKSDKDFIIVTYEDENRLSDRLKSIKGLHVSVVNFNAA